MYRFIKVKRSVLPAIPIWNSYTQKFHVSCKKYVRGARTTNNVVPGNNENEIDPAFIRQDSSVDFLGIESGEGVITLKSPQHSLPQLIQERKLKEKFHCTSFGVVRYDAENKLKFHGQYPTDEENCWFPRSKSEYAEVSKKLQELPNETVSYSNTFHSNKGTSKSHESRDFEKKDRDESYIDECYFSSVTEREKITSKVNGSHPSSEKLSFLDETYFGTLNTSEDVKSSEYPETEDLKYSKNFNSEKGINEIIFERQHLTKDDNLTQSAKQELNFFDENYFKNVTASETQEFSNSHKLSHDLPNAETTLGYNKKEILEVNNNENFLTNLKPDIDDLNDYSLQNNATSFVENNHVLHEPVDYKTGSVFPPNEGEILAEFNQHDEEYNKDFGQEVQDDFEYSNTSPDILNANFLSKQKRQLMANKIKSNIQTVKSDIRENNLKGSSEASEEMDDVSTAHEFVKNLRKEQEISQPNIKKGKDPKEEKFDSKGFRILTNQVDNLAYFTRDEIFDILKRNIVYSDDDLLVLNKPYGLVMHDSKTTKIPCLSTFLDDLAKEMDKKSTSPKLFTVHRIDKETTGCLLLARNETMATFLKSLFAQRKIIKKYWIITTKVPDPPEGVIDIPISEGSINNKQRMVLHPELPKDIPYRNHSKQGKQATTSYKVLLESGNAALVEAFPKTGIKHQIRVHFGFGLSCPILGDHKYSHLHKLAPQKLPSDILQRLHVRQSKVRHIAMHIHAKSVIIPDYFKDRNLLVNVPLPNHMKVNLKRLKFRKKDLVG